MSEVGERVRIITLWHLLSQLVESDFLSSFFLNLDLIFFPLGKFWGRVSKSKKKKKFPMTPSEIKSSIIFPFIFHSYRVKSLRSRSPLSRFRSLVSLLRNPFHRDTDILNANLKLTPRKKNKKMCSAIIVHPKKKEEKNNLRRVAGD